MNNPLVSILVPVYGVEKYIERCARSLFDQTYENVEFIFVDDCSPDSSMDILNNVLQDYPNRISQVLILHHKKNRGLAAARTTALDACHGEFVWQMDSDDWVEPSAIEQLIKFQEQTDADLINMDYVMEDKESHFVVNNNYDDSKSLTLAILRREAPINVWSYLVRQSLFEEQHLRVKEGVDMSEDYQMTPRLAYYANRINIFHKPLYHYNCINLSSYTKNFSEKSARQSWETITILNDFFKDKGQEYLDALECGSLDICRDQRLNAARHGDRAYYKLMDNKLRTINKDYQKKFGLGYRLTFRIHNYYVVRLLTKIFDLMKGIGL